MGLVAELWERGYDVEELSLVDGRRVGGFGAGVFRSLTDRRYVSLLRSDLARLIRRSVRILSATASPASSCPKTAWV
jgi:hypothetical protein